MNDFHTSPKTPLRIRPFGLLAAGSLLLAAGLGCGSSLLDNAYLMQNPLRTGTIAQNHVTARDSMDERAYGLPPGSLTSEATLSSVNQSEICFNVVLRTVGQRADLANPQSWRVFLRGIPEFEDMGSTVKSVTPPTSGEMQGMVTQQMSEQQRICDNYGNCVNRTVQRNFTTPSMITVIAGGGVVCFANNNHINPGTKEIALYFDDPHTIWPAQRRVAFGWRFPETPEQKRR